jgi:hypothetical protein
LKPRIRTTRSTGSPAAARAVEEALHVPHVREYALAPQPDSVFDQRLQRGQETRISSLVSARSDK